jgi:molybdate transport system substrate-binding protein
VGRSKALVMLLAVVTAAAACGGGDDDGAAPTSNPESSATATIHTVPQLEPVVTSLVDAYESEASGRQLDLSVGPPSDVVEAVSGGAPAILPGAWLAGVEGDSVVLGRNLAIIVVPEGNPGQVTGVDVFASYAGLSTAICGVDSPYGNFAALVVERGGVKPDPSEVGAGCEADAVARVAGGELDAALVFRNNVQIPDDVEVINIPDDQNLVIDIRYAPVAGEPTDGSFAQFLESDRADQILTEQGLLP